MLTKASMRQCLLRRRATLTRTEIQQKSAVIATYVYAMPAFCTSRVVMVYMALPKEVQTTMIIAEARRRQQRIAVPVVRDNNLIAVELPLQATRLQRGAHGIFEPSDITGVVPLASIDCVLTPGVAFDRCGGRLGFGQGYYDRFLCQLPATTYLCGLAFSIQVVPCVPRMLHDICMQMLATEQGLIPCMSPLPSEL
jgi:5-formyltetrahydrofolate cyclo-ligase